MIKKKFVLLSILLLLVLSLLNIKMTRVSAAEPHAIYIDPASIVDPNLTPGENFTISIYTDYNGTNIHACQFDLTYNPNVLQGTSVTNGDLITEEKIPGSTVNFFAGTFDNTLGELSLTGASFYFKYPEPAPMTYGPGTLANVTFTVVGKGTSDIILGPSTGLGSFNEEGRPYLIPLDIHHGYFDNRLPHDVTVVSVTAPDKAVVGSPMSIGVEVANIGKSNETVDVAVSYDSVPIETKPVPLLVGASETVLFSLNTTDITEGTYTINATATIPEEGDPTDNWKNTTFLVVHDVAVTSVPPPLTAPVGSLVSISVEVTNEGSFAELVNVTIRDGSILIGFNDTVVLPAQNSTLFLFDWNTTGVVKGTYTINATATIPEDDDPTDNWKTTTISLVAHDVTVVSVTAPAKAAVGSLVSISVEVTNKGAFDELVNVTIRYDTTYIDSENVTLLVGASKTVLLNWTTTDVDMGTYTINATATTVAVDDVPTDNWKNTTILLAVHDVAVIIPTAPDTVYVGELVTIEGFMKNNGGYNETFALNLTISYEATIVETQTKNVTLLFEITPRNYPFSFNWTTTGVAPASYTITIEAILAEDIEDANPTDNRDNSTVTVELPPGAIAGTVTDSSTNDPIEGANVVANGYSDTTDADGHYNITDVPPGTYNVTVSAAKYINQSKTATVTADTTTTLDFTLTPLNGTISGRVTDSSTGDPISGANVTANGVSVSTDADGSYSIELAPGNYTVEASVDGYESASQSDVTVVAGETTIMDFELTPTLTPPSGIPWYLYVAAAGVAVIIMATIAFYFLRIRKPKPT